MRERQYSDIEYFNHVYLDAELIQGKWYVEDVNGMLHAFAVQRWAKPTNSPSSTRRHPVHRSGHVLEPGGE